MKTQTANGDSYQLVSRLSLKNPQKFLNFQAYIKGWIKINGFECLGRKGNLEDRQSWFELCEPMIKHRDIFNTLNTKNALLTFCFLSPSTGNDVFFETLRFVQSECWDHNFEANHWREEESNITAQKHTQAFTYKPFVFVQQKSPASDLDSNFIYEPQISPQNQSSTIFTFMGES